jgi:hypothetical protein
MEDSSELEEETGRIENWKTGLKRWTRKNETGQINRTN